MEDIWITFFRLLIAALFGGVIGLERDIHGRAAGVRTHLLVSAGAALFTIVSINIAKVSGMRCDGARIAAQIVSGIGFLGAGMIIQNGINIKGLTTAACLWTVAAIGMATGIGLYAVAAFTTLVVLIALTTFKGIERRFRRSYQLRIALQTRTLENMESIRLFLKSMPDVSVEESSLVCKPEQSIVSTQLTLDITSSHKQSELTEAMARALASKKDLLLSFSLNCKD